MKKFIGFVCGLVCGAALFGVMAMTLFDVLGRKLFDQSIPGSLELTEFFMVAVIFAAMPLVSLRKEHVTFDSLDSVLPAWLRLVQSKVVDLLCVALFIGLGWLMWKAGIKFANQGDQSAQLAIAKAPFVYAMAVFLWVVALVHLRQLFDRFGAQSAGTAEGEGTAL